MKGSNNLCPMGRRKSYKAPQGLVKQKHSNNWYIKINVNGRIIYKSTKTPDLQLAELKLAKVRVALHPRVNVTPLSRDSDVKEIIGRSKPFSQLMERYLKEVSINKRSAESDRFRSKPLVEFFKDLKIDSITVQDVYKYQDWRKKQIGPKSKRPISGPSINREISLLRHAFRKAVRWGYLDFNPIQDIEGFSENVRERYITDQEFEAIKKAALSHPYSRHLSDIVDILYHTGQRLQRILSLRWNQIDLDERTIRFEQVSKTKQVPSVIWINDYLYQLLLRLRSQRSLSKIIGPYVFQKKDGKPYRSINRTWKTACMKAKVGNARIHDMRHKAITDMVRGGYSLEHVGRVAGHSTPAVTKRYTHLAVEATKEPLEALAKRGKLLENS